MKSPASWLTALGVNQEWTLFLDRDGIINVHFPNDYVRNTEEFVLLNSVPQTIAALSEYFGRIIVVTNQQGVGKGLMTKEELDRIHAVMLEIISEAGGKIDAVYAATELVSEDILRRRKPGIGMALEARSDFPEIDFSKSVMVGDSLTDLQFGRNAGMFTVWKTDKETLSLEESLLTDRVIQSLEDLLEN